VLSSCNSLKRALLTTAVLALLPPAVQAEASASRPAASAVGAPVTLVAVDDGDIIRVSASKGKLLTVRLACIDAPEAAQKPAGPAARAALQALLPVGASVTLQLRAANRDGRTVAEVFKPGEAGSVNLQMVSQGMAFFDRQSRQSCDQYSYGEAETGASVSKRGVWGPKLGYDLMFPWDYRKCRSEGRCR